MSQKFKDGGPASGINRLRFHNQKSEIGNRKSEILPFVLVNMAMSADGKIASANRAITSFGSPHDHEHLLELRATANAVMAGARTVDSAKINMGPGPKKFRRKRLKHGLAEYNLRVIVSRSGSVNPNAEIFKHKFTGANKTLTRPDGHPVPSDGRGAGSEGPKSPIIILTTQRAGESRLKRLRVLADEVKICGRKEINFRAAFRWLRKKWGVQRLLSEGGGELNDALFRANLVNELHLTICPKILGGRNAPTIADGTSFPPLTNAASFSLKIRRRVGDEMFLVFSNDGRNAALRRPRTARRSVSLPTSDATADTSGRNTLR